MLTITVWSLLGLGKLLLKFHRIRKDLTMAGKVFISCGQRPPEETKIAQEIKGILSTEFSLTPYLAFKIQSLSDIMTITNELRTSDYYLFIDFLRRHSRAEDL